MTKRILPLSYIPKEGHQITDWCPFEGDSLQRILNKNNNKCRKYHEDLGWIPEDIDSMITFIQPVMYDLNHVAMLRESDFESIHILLLDLSAVGKWNQDFNRIRVYMNRHRHRYYLIQVSKSPHVSSFAGYFNGMPVYTLPMNPPQILKNQESFEDLLWRLSVPFPPPKRAIGFSVYFPPPPPEDPGGGGGIGGGGGEEGKQEYLQAISKVGEDVRHTAIMENLSEKEMFALANNAIQQEFSLYSIEKMLETKPNDQVNFDSIREPVSKMSFEPFDESNFQQANLIQVCPKSSMQEITPKQRRIFDAMGIRGENYTAVTYNIPSTRDRINKLGSAIEINEFTASLPFTR